MRETQLLQQFHNPLVTYAVINTVALLRGEWIHRS